MSKQAAAREINERLQAKQHEFFALWDSKPARDFTPDETSTLKQLEAEMQDIGAKRDLIILEAAAEREMQRAADDAKTINTLPTPSAGMPKDENGAVQGRPHVKSLYQCFRESTQYQALKAGAIKTATLDVPHETIDAEVGQVGTKTLLAQTAWSFQSDRRPGIIESALTDLTVSDLMMQGTVNGPSFSYMTETTFTNAAAEVAEGGTKPEAALAFTETTEQVRKIAVNLPATDEILQDEPGMLNFIRGRLVYMVDRRREQQILTGTGVSPNLLGLLNRTGIQTQAKGTDPTPDAIYRAITKVRVTGAAEPTAVVIHPNDWQDIRLLRTADGVYIWGNPSEPGNERIWGLPVRQTTGITENTALVGAFRPFAEVRRRTGLAVTISTEHSTFFTENKVMIQVEERLGLAVYRATAFCTVTGI